VSDSQILRTIFTEFPFALFGSVVAGVLCSYFSVYVISKRVVFVGAALTQAAVAGIAFAHLPFVHSDPLVGSIAFTLLTVVLFSRLLQSRQMPRDSVLGAAYVGSIALRILLIEKSPAAEVSEIEAILKGDMLFITGSQFYLLLGVAVVLLTIHLVFYKEFIFVTLDPETATTQGFNSARWELLFYLTVGIAISVAIRMVGDVFVFGFLVMPAITAILLANRVKSLFVIAVIFGALPPILGLFLAFKLDIPAGPSTVATSFLMMSGVWILTRLKK
jgi:ABC-type Mn2+/Zn2+ transport system permease subunit